jgi:hypothetical protein
MQFALLKRREFVSLVGEPLTCPVGRCAGLSSEKFRKVHSQTDPFLPIPMARQTGRARNPAPEE